MDNTKYIISIMEAMLEKERYRQLSPATIQIMQEDLKYLRGLIKNESKNK